MPEHQEKSQTNSDNCIPLSESPQKPRLFTRKDYSRLDAETNAYLLADRQKLKELAQEARDAGNEFQARRLTYRYTYYYIVEEFFIYLVECGYSTRITEITTEQIKAFFKRERQPKKAKTAAKTTPHNGDNSKELEMREKMELKAFFNRVVENGIIAQNPVIPLSNATIRLEPQNPSPQTRADISAFYAYLQLRVKNGLLSPGTAQRYHRHCRTLLHDAELYHAKDPEWPTELDRLFTDPKWINTWLMDLENRSGAVASKELTHGSAYGYLISVRRIWLFLKSEGRVTKNYYEELKEMLRLDDSKDLLLPGRGSQIIKPLSEAEVANAFAAIQRSRMASPLKLRNMALLITGIETTMRMESLHSMRLENFVELQPGVYAWRVKAKSSSKKGRSSRKRNAGTDTKLQLWYLSPHAHAVITAYLEATGRNWQSQGPVWLSNKSRPLSPSGQKKAIADLLRSAKCDFKRPHVLRHTGVDRLINKFYLPISIVKTISQHVDPEILLGIYAKRADLDAYNDINQLFPAEEENAAKYEEVLLSISVKLNEISAEIGRQDQKKHIFTRKDVEKTLDILGDLLTSLATFLDYETITEQILFAQEVYFQIEVALQAQDLSYQQLLGYEPEVQRRTPVKATGRTPKSLLDS